MSNEKVAFITGISGQDGYYLTKLLLQKKYIVHGMIRRSSSINTYRLDKLYQDPHEKDVKLFLHYGDLSDANCIERLIRQIKPDEVYNLGAMSHVRVSFDIPEYTSDINALGALRLIEACRTIVPHVKFYQASTSELYGGLQTQPQDENTPFNPRSPYAISKLYGFWTIKNYRDAYNIYACNGILFNHTSPYRGETFVESKIVKAAVAIKNNKQSCLYLGNIYAVRDIGHSEDYVYGMWLMLQQAQPDDYVLATGSGIMIKDIVIKVFNYLEMPLTWSGDGENETATCNGNIVVRIDPRYYRPTEVSNLIGNAAKAHDTLGWKPKYNMDMILEEMIEKEMEV